MVQRLSVTNAKEASVTLERLISTPLEKGKKVLWLVSGGSSLPIAADAFRMLEHKLLHNLAITLVDDKYLPAGDMRSNGAKFRALGFDPGEVKYTEILCNENMARTIELFEAYLKGRLAWADIAIGQFGLGEGHHTGGILPHSLAADVAIGYEQDEVARVTITSALVCRLDVAFVNSMGEEKRPLIEHFLGSTADATHEPTQLLKLARHTYLCSDVL